MKVWCLECDRAGERAEFDVASGDDLLKLGDHYEVAHPDVDIDDLADAEIVTMFPARLEAKS